MTPQEHFDECDRINRKSTKIIIAAAVISVMNIIVVAWHLFR